MAKGILVKTPVIMTALGLSLTRFNHSDINIKKMNTTTLNWKRKLKCIELPLRLLKKTNSFNVRILATNPSVIVKPICLLNVCFSFKSSEW